MEAAVGMACMSIARDKVNKRREAGLSGPSRKNPYECPRPARKAAICLLAGESDSPGEVVALHCARIIG